MKAVLEGPLLVDTRAHESAGRGLYGWAATLDHKRIGLLYLFTALFFFIVAGSEALLIRIQLIQPGMKFLSPDVFNQAFTPAQVQGLYNGTYVLGPQYIQITPSGTHAVLTWQTGTLLQSTNVLGPWTTNSTASSPYLVPETNKASFFRLLVSP